MTNLKQFAEKASTRSRCPVCNLPANILKEVRDGRKGDFPISYNLISQWLREQGHEVKMRAVSNHFLAHEIAKD